MEEPDIILTKGQAEGYDKFVSFYLNPNERVMLLKGYSGTGKSTLVSYIIKSLGQLNQLAGTLIENFVEPQVILTATTNQAAEALSIASGQNDTQTIHKVLGLRVHRDLKTGKTELVPRRRGVDMPTNCLIVVDEGSFIDNRLLGYMFSETEDCKFLIMGDPAQFTPVGSSFMPAFEMKAVSHELTEVKRQASGPLYDLCMELRQTVFGGPWPKINIDGDQIRHVTQEQFDAMTEDAFLNPDVWGRSKVLAYTNQRVNQINQRISAKLHGTSEPFPGQRMICNTAVTTKHVTISTGEEVMVEDVRPERRFDLDGWLVHIRAKGMFFLPADYKEARKRETLGRKLEEWDVLQAMANEVVDLRPSFACTVNKSQGSTFDTTFLDLNDICQMIRSPNQLARALYVGFSRSRKRVILTGDM